METKQECETMKAIEKCKEAQKQLKKRQQKYCSELKFLFSTVQNGVFFIFNGATFFETIVAVGI